MPQLHHRDPAIIGLLGAGGQYSTVEIGQVPSLVSTSSSSSPTSPTKGNESAFAPLRKKVSELILGGPSVNIPGSSSAVDLGDARKSRDHVIGMAEALDDFLTPPQTPHLRATPSTIGGPWASSATSDNEEWSARQQKGMPGLAEGDIYARPYYGLIVDGIHSHPNSVRVSWNFLCRLYVEFYRFSWIFSVKFYSSWRTPLIPRVVSSLQTVGLDSTL